MAVVRLLPPGAAAGAGAGGKAEPAGARFLLVQRPPAGLLAGLWQFPLLPLQPGAQESAAAAQALMDGYLQEQLGVELRAAQAAQQEDSPDDGPGARGSRGFHSCPHAAPAEAPACLKAALGASSAVACSSGCWPAQSPI